MERDHRSRPQMARAETAPIRRHAQRRHRVFPQDRKRQAVVELRQSGADREEDGALSAKEEAGRMAKKKKRNGNGAKEPAEASRFILGHSQIFTPNVMNDIHVKSELGRYRMRGFSLFKKIPHWDDLTFLPGTLTRFVIEGYRISRDSPR